jgi:hypothetical protein
MYLPTQYRSDVTRYSIVYEETENRYFIRIWENDTKGWQYPYGSTWYEARDGFRTIADAENWLNMHDWETATVRQIEKNDESFSSHFSEFTKAMEMLGFEPSKDNFYGNTPVYEGFYKIEEPLASEYENPSYKRIEVRVMYYENEISVDYWINHQRVPKSLKPKESASVDKTIKAIERFLSKHGIDIFASTMMVATTDRQSIMAAINTRDLSRNLARTRSSNIWAYGINVRNYKDKVGDVVVQFKDKTGGPGHVYIYYDVPVRVYQRWMSSPSKGHYFWQYIRPIYKYSKLTGNKRGVLPHAVN